MMSVCSVESAYQESRKSKKQIVKGSNGCLKRQNEITDNDEVISGGNEKIIYQQIEFLQKKIAVIYVKESSANFSYRDVIIYNLTCRSFGPIQFEFIFVHVLENILISFFYM